MPTKEAPLIEATGRRLPKGNRGGIELLLVHTVEHLGKQGEVVEVKETSKQLTVVLEASQLAERDVPDYYEVDHGKMVAKLTRVPLPSEVPYPVMMEPNLVIEFYSR